MSLPSGLSSYEFQRVLTPSRDLPYYYHLRLLHDEKGVPLLIPEDKPAVAKLDISQFFGVPGPIEIEVGCGKGTFMQAYCDKHPELPFLALEKEAEIAFIAATRLSKRKQLSHARVVLGDALLFFKDFLPDGCAKAFHVYFPDPWPKKRHHKHRLMQANFLQEVRRVATAGATFFFGTDHAGYNEETQELFRQTPWLEMIEANAEPTEGIQTNFEIKYRRVGKPIYRCVLKISK